MRITETSSNGDAYADTGLLVAKPARPEAPSQSAGLTGLAGLEARLAQDLAWLDLPCQPWVPSSEVNGEALLDVAIIGGGMAGLAAATSLRHLGLRACIFDSAPAGYEGPWATTARMETLRSPKQLTGPALGLPALTFRAWFEAQFGLSAWEALDKIPRLQWMDYLRWYRKVLNLDVRNEHCVIDIVPHEDYVTLKIQAPQGLSTVHARRVVLATGRAGLGGAYIPDFMRTVSRKYWAHSSDTTDYTTLRGLRVGVVGAGASAMDSAATALENGAARVDMLIRRADIPRVNKGKGAGNAGFTHGYQHLPDDWKWRIRHYINVQQVPPPRASVLRVSRHDNAYFNLGTPVQRVLEKDGYLQVDTPNKTFEVDFLILSTGFFVDWHARPEYATIAPHIRLWGERYQPGEGQEDRELEGSPDLGPVFEFQEKQGHPMPGLSRIHCLCYPATLTHGTVSGDIPAISDGAERLSKGIASLLFCENVSRHFEDLQTFDEPEVFGDEWTPAA
ncbi:NAD(P)-binding domain-containing protein [Allopusillimonas ginsengisoli]|uniref:NAD(P)-binding domain-containing protein n=1 Tax=Allopusillimonas ginsengisoli TaxID=453575 RepID=UPI00101F1DD7|nr:NAD(P)/FAD-dependent oxidoreductase [Allopusillimonas ginsengisoli]TEA76957.1 NAD(P)/FAD-dependent oxidoreductase [Allopusillimonas ginsengisoli]